MCCHIQLFVWVPGVKLRPAGFSGKHFTCGALSLVPEVCFEGSIYELIEDTQRLESKQGKQKFQSSRRKGVGGRANTWVLYPDSLGIVSLPSQMGAKCSLSGK